jgi:hypothetical protein
VTELSDPIEQCVRCLRSLATGQGNIVVTRGAIRTLELLSNLAPKSAETIRAQTLVAAFHAFELRLSTNAIAARHELELAVFRACE